MLAVAAISYEPLVRIRLGPLAVSPHGIATALAFVAGTALMLPAARRRGISDEVVYDIVTRAMIGGIVGARFFYVVNNLSSFESPLEWFAVWEGGITLLGGIFGAIVANVAYLRRRGLSFFEVMDAAVPGLALGIAIGRVGDLVIADHLGAPTTLPFGFRCPAVVDVGRTVGSRCPAGEVVHLTALYDLIAASVVLGLLLLIRRRQRPVGDLSLIGAITYGIGRFAFDFLRADPRRLGLTASQWVALTIVGVSAGSLVRRRRRRLPHASEELTDSGNDGQEERSVEVEPLGARAPGSQTPSQGRIEKAEEPRAAAGDDQSQQ